MRGPVTGIGLVLGFFVSVALAHHIDESGNPHPAFQELESAIKDFDAQLAALDSRSPDYDTLLRLRQQLQRKKDNILLAHEGHPKSRLELAIDRLNAEIARLDEEIRKLRQEIQIKR